MIKIKTKDKKKRILGGIRNTLFLSIKGDKGGTGKSTFSRKFAMALAKNGLNALIFDFDEQQNTSKILESDKTVLTINYMFDPKNAKTLTEKSILKIIKFVKVKWSSNSITIVPGTDSIESDVRYIQDSFFKKNRQYAGCWDMESFFEKFIINPLREYFDIVLFDLPPGLSTTSQFSQLVMKIVNCIVQPIDGESALEGCLSTIEWLRRETEIRDDKPDCLFVMSRYSPDTKLIEMTEFSNKKYALNTIHGILLNSFPDHTLHNGVKELSSARAESTKNRNRKDSYSDACIELIQMLNDKRRRNICDVISDNPKTINEFEENIQKYKRNNKPLITLSNIQFVPYNRIKRNVRQLYKEGKSIEQIQKKYYHLTKEDIRSIIRGARNFATKY